MLFVTLSSEIFCFTSHFTANLLTVIADRIARLLTTSGATQAVALDISNTFYIVLGYLAFWKGVLSYWGHLVVVKDFYLIWSTSHLVSVPLMLEYLGIFFRYFLLWLNKRELNKAVWETEKFIYRLKNIKGTF